MSIDEILNLMDELVENSASLPLSGGKKVVDAEKLRNMIDDIRANMPSEVKQARMIVSDRSEIIANARQESDRLIAKAEEKAEQMVAEEEITRMAKARAEEVIRMTQNRCNEQMRAAADFTDKLIASTEEMLMGNLKAVRDAKEVIHRNRHNTAFPVKDNAIDINIDNI